MPGKVLADVGGRPLLSWLLERLDHAETLDDVVVATSDDPSDDPVAAYCDEHGVACFRGPLHDVARRMLGAAHAAGLDAFVRVNGDSPLLDQALVDRGVALLLESGADLVTNVRPRTYPPGQSVEVVRTDALAAAIEAGMSAEASEHVTGPLYDGGYAVVRFEAERPRTEPSLTVDTPEDSERIGRILAGLGDAHWKAGWEQVA